MTFSCVTNYVPFFNAELEIVADEPQSHRVIKNAKLKIYNKCSRIDSLSCEFTNLKRDGYTHIVNMPGVWDTICYFARCNQIAVIDSRVKKCISKK